MLYLLYGEDDFRSREKLKDLVNFFREKTFDSGIPVIDGSNFDSSKMEEYFKTQTLFGGKRVVVCENFLKFSEAKDFIKENMESISKAGNIFIFWEDEVGSEELSLFEKHCQKIQKFGLLSGATLRKWMNERTKISMEKQNEIMEFCGSDLWCASREIEKCELGGESPDKKDAVYNIFAICDAFSEKSKIKIWTVFQQGIMSGIGAEEMFWKMVGHIKNLLMLKKIQAEGVKNLTEESGLHPYVVKKSLSALEKFSEDELKKYSFDLVKLYHDARRSAASFPEGLEKFIINF